MFKISHAIFALTFIIILSFTLVESKDVLTKDPNTFGPYIVSWTSYELCKGSKLKNLTMITINLIKEGENTVAYYNFTFLSQATIEAVKILVYSVKQNTKNLLWTYKINEPCKHFAIGTVIEKFMKSRNCVINKATYTFVLNFNQMTSMFLGSSFFYGDYLMKASIVSKEGNIMCAIIELNFKKKST